VVITGVITTVTTPIIKDHPINRSSSPSSGHQIAEWVGLLVSRGLELRKIQWIGTKSQTTLRSRKCTSKCGFAANRNLL
jgi:hypothetical protein